MADVRTILELETEASPVNTSLRQPTEPGLSAAFNEVLDGFLQYLKLARNAIVAHRARLSRRHHAVSRLHRDRSPNSAPAASTEWSGPMSAPSSPRCSRATTSAPPSPANSRRSAPSAAGPKSRAISRTTRRSAS